MAARRAASIVGLASPCTVTGGGTFGAAGAFLGPKLITLLVVQFPFKSTAEETAARFALL